MPREAAETVEATEPGEAAGNEEAKGRVSNLFIVRGRVGIDLEDESAGSGLTGVREGVGEEVREGIGVGVECFAAFLSSSSSRVTCLNNFGYSLSNSS